MSRLHRAILNGQDRIDVTFAGSRRPEQVEMTNPAGTPPREEPTVVDQTAVGQ